MCVDDLNFVKNDIKILWKYKNTFLRTQNLLHLMLSVTDVSRSGYFLIDTLGTPKLYNSGNSYFTDLF